MMMKSIRARAIVDSNLVNITLARRDRVHRMPIHALWDIQAMPMHDALLGQMILKMEAYSLAAPNELVA